MCFFPPSHLAEDLNGGCKCSLVKAVSWACFLLAQLCRRSMELLACFALQGVRAWCGVQPTLLKHRNT